MITLDCQLVFKNKKICIALKFSAGRLLMMHFKVTASLRQKLEFDFDYKHACSMKFSHRCFGFLFASCEIHATR